MHADFYRENSTVINFKRVYFMRFLCCGPSVAKLSPVHLRAACWSVCVYLVRTPGSRIAIAAFPMETDDFTSFCACQLVSLARGRLRIHKAFALLRAPVNYISLSGPAAERLFTEKERHRIQLSTHNENGFSNVHPKIYTVWIATSTNHAPAGTYICVRERDLAAAVGEKHIASAKKADLKESGW